MMYEQHVGIGLGINTNTNYLHSDATMITINMDYLTSERMVYGFELGIGKSISDEQNYTGTVSQFAYREDVDGVVYSQFMLAGRIGYQLNPTVYFVGTVGASWFHQYQERFDSFYILGYDGVYFVSTDLTETESYLKGSIVYKPKNWAFEIGYANAGIGLGVNYFFN